MTHQRLVLLFKIQSSKTHRIEIKSANLIFGALFLLMLLSPFALQLSENPYSYTPQCVHMKYQGNPCQTCGITREILGFYKGDLDLHMFAQSKGLYFILFLFVQLLLRIISFKYPQMIRFDFAQLIILSTILGIFLNS